MEDLFGRDSLSKALRERVSEPILTLAKAELAEVLRAPALVGYGVKADKQKRGWNMEPLQSESSESLCSRVTTAKKHNPTLRIKRKVEGRISRDCAVGYTAAAKSILNTADAPPRLLAIVLLAIIISPLEFEFHPLDPRCYRL